MQATTIITRAAHRHVVEFRQRSRPRDLLMSLPVDAIEAPLVPDVGADDPDALPGRGRLGSAY